MLESEEEPEGNLNLAGCDDESCKEGCDTNSREANSLQGNGQSDTWQGNPWGYSDPWTIQGSGVWWGGIAWFLTRRQNDKESAEKNV